MFALWSSSLKVSQEMITPEIDISDDSDDRYAKEAFSKPMRLGQVSLRGLTPDEHACQVL